MTDIYLEPNDTFELLNVNTNIDIYGSTGSETVTLRDYPAGTRLDGNIETLQILGSASETTLQVNNTTGQLELVNSGTVFASFFGGLNQSVDLQFTDGNVTLTQTGASTFQITSPELANNWRVVDLHTTQPANAVSLGFDKFIAEYGWQDENTYISGGDTPNGYNIEFNVYNTVNPVFLEGIANAAETISDIITGDLPSHGGVDDLLVNIYFGYLGYGAWGTGAVDLTRPDSMLPSRGTMMLDHIGSQTAANQGAFEDLVVHEFLHTMGFGTRWEALGLIDDYNGDLRFNGAEATAYYNSEFSSIAANDPLSHLGVPVETGGIVGSAGSHWDDATFGNELMSTYINPSNTISNMTIASLSDMGYDVML